MNLFFTPTKIPEVVIVDTNVYRDDRGYFTEGYSKEHFADAGINAEFVQDNYSQSYRGSLRGMHLQTSNPQGKLVRVTRGRGYDVAVDMRPHSPTLGQWVGVELSDENHRQLWVPEGFAHGILAMSDTMDFIYKCTGKFSPEYHLGLYWGDPTVGIEWPDPGAKIFTSGKDAQGAAMTFEAMLAEIRRRS